jgi:hypothetical protein
MDLRAVSPIRSRPGGFHRTAVAPSMYRVHIEKDDPTNLKAKGNGLIATDKAS